MKELDDIVVQFEVAEGHFIPQLVKAYLMVCKVMEWWLLMANLWKVYMIFCVHKDLGPCYEQEPLLHFDHPIIVFIFLGKRGIPNFEVFGSLKTSWVINWLLLWCMMVKFLSVKESLQRKLWLSISFHSDLLHCNGQDGVIPWILPVPIWLLFQNLQSRSWCPSLIYFTTTISHRAWGILGNRWFSIFSGNLWAGNFEKLSLLILLTLFLVDLILNIFSQFVNKFLRGARLESWDSPGYALPSLLKHLVQRPFSVAHSSLILLFSKIKCFKYFIIT